MRDPNEPSVLDHNAPYNEDDEGNCACYFCKKERRNREEQHDDFLYEYERERRWLKDEQT